MLREKSKKCHLTFWYKFSGSVNASMELICAAIWWRLFLECLATRCHMWANTVWLSSRNFPMSNWVGLLSLASVMTRCLNKTSRWWVRGMTLIALSMATKPFSNSPCDKNNNFFKVLFVGVITFPYSQDTCFIILVHFFYLILSQAQLNIDQ